MRRRMLPEALSAIALAITLGSLLLSPKSSQAMPTFAEAYGVSCNLCHTQVPLLNAYGRYVQRTGYASLDRVALKRAIPIWIGESINTDSTAGAGSGTPRIDTGNLAVHGAGYLAPDITFHLHQWISQGSKSGGVDTLWVTYNNLLHRDGHLFVGKIENPAPSPYSQNFDLDGPSASGGVVGEHDWAATYNNRWGTKLAYTHSWFNAEAAYLLSGDDLNGVSDFNPGDKTFQWKVAYARPTRPIEAGFFGSNGAIPVSSGSDRYSAIGAYVQIDPIGHGVPGLLAVHQIKHDTSPGLDAASGNLMPATTSRGTSLELYEPIFHGGAVFSMRHDFNDNGYGTLTNGNTLNLGFNVGKIRWVHGYLEANLGGNSALAGASGGPTWKGMLWLTLPIAPVRP